MTCDPLPPLLAAVPLGLWSPPSVAGAGAAPFQTRPADRGTLEQVIAESRATTSPPRPGPSRYVRDAGITFSEWLAAVVERLLPGFGRAAEWFLAAAWGLLLAVLAGLAVLLGIGLARRWWPDRSAPRPPPGSPLPAPAVPGAGSAEAWETELRRRLAGGDVAAAVEALWWWLASVLTAGDVDPSWTSLELVVHAGRTDLGPWIRRLDRMIYGRESPPAEDVRHLFDDLRTAA
jgi:hypothetical protein